MTSAPVPPGSIIGVLGGGQLGRMLALAAARLGYRTHVFTPEADGPAAQVTNRVTLADYDDEAALTAFARSVAVATYEFENIPACAAAIVGAHAPERPSAEILAICQDRLAEKRFLNDIGVATTEFAAVGDPAALARALESIGRPAILKTLRLGYDGKGQVAIREQSAEAAWRVMAEAGAPGDAATGIVERWVDFSMEISVVVARGGDGAFAAYDPVQNVHENHVLKRTIAPAPIPPALAARAVQMARTVADRLGLVGVLAVEMFATEDGRLLVNELAPRPHNSGHWTIDACAVSQFEQCVRAIAGLPLGPSDRHADAVMENLLGSEALTRWPALAASPEARLHLYGKDEARDGRKMGHVTWLRPRA